jgi:hypothetical protein
MATEKRVIDWELVEKHYRAGILSNVQIAEECGLSEGMIRKRAKKDQWPKDLSVKIKQRTEELVRAKQAQAVRGPSTSLTPITEKQTVEANAEAAAIVLIAQKGSISRSHNLFRALMDELEETTNNKELFAQLGELMDTSSEDDDGRVRQDKLAQIYQKVLSLPGRVDSAKKVVEILEKLVKMEREAFGIDAEKQDNPVDAALKALVAFRANRL